MDYADEIAGKEPEHKKYKVIWETEVEARDPYEAAKLASQAPKNSFTVQEYKVLMTPKTQLVETHVDMRQLRSDPPTLNENLDAIGDAIKGMMKP